MCTDARIIESVLCVGLRDIIWINQDSVLISGILIYNANTCCYPWSICLLIYKCSKVPDISVRNEGGGGPAQDPGICAFQGDPGGSLKR